MKTVYWVYLLVATVIAISLLIGYTRIQENNYRQVCALEVDGLYGNPRTDQDMTEQRYQELIENCLKGYKTP